MFLMYRQKDVKIESEVVSDSERSENIFLQKFATSGCSILKLSVRKKDCASETVPESKRRRVKWIFNVYLDAFSNKLLSLLNLLCNSTQNSSTVVRDACYGCFFRVGVLTPGATLLNQLSQCANIYLSNTSYAGCATQLAVSAILIIQCKLISKEVNFLHFKCQIWSF